MHKVGYAVRVYGSKAVVGCFVSCRDVPELFAHGEDVAEALLSASRALGSTFRRYKAAGRAAPTATAPQQGEWLIYPGA